MKPFDLLLTVSALASQSNFTARGFRLKDMRFVFELCANWLSAVLPPVQVRVHNTQVQRYMRDLVRGGFAKAQERGGQTRFHLTRMGLLELLQRLNNQEQGDYTGFHFTYYFLRTYGPRLRAMIEMEGSGFAKSLQLELKVLLDHQRFLTQRLEQLDRKIERLKVRMKETEETAELADRLQRQGESVEQIIERVARDYPYELEAQRPMAAFMKEISPEQRLWELTAGNRHRVDVMWKAVLAELLAQKETLRQFQSTRPGSS